VFAIEFMQCMNYAAVSPDGKKLVRAGGKVEGRKERERGRRRGKGRV
jgi:hypothetical protein